METGKLGSGPAAETTSCVRTRAVQVALATASATGRQSRRQRVLRRAAQVADGTAHVAVDLSQVTSVKSVDAIGDNVTRFSTSKTTKRLRVAPGTAHVRTVSTLVPRRQAIVAQPVRTIPSDVRLVSAQVTRFLLRRKLALGLAMSSSSATKASKRRRFVIFVEIPRLTQNVAHLFILLVVLRRCVV